MQYNAKKIAKATFFDFFDIFHPEYSRTMAKVGLKI